jgi:hypothetical protein
MKKGPFVPDRGNLLRPSLLQIGITKWIYAPIRGDALDVALTWLLVSWRTRESAFRALRITLGASRYAGASL